jgi:hypothetical protein
MAHERVVGRDGVWSSAVDIEAEHGPEESLGTLPVVLRIAGGASIAEAHVEHAVRAEGEHATVVVREGLVHREDRRARARVGHVGVFGHGVADDLGARVVRIRVVHEEMTVHGVLGMKRHPEQPPLSARPHQGPDVQKRLLAHDAGLHDHDPPGSLHDEESGVAGRGGEKYRLVEPLHDELDRDLARNHGLQVGAVGAARESDRGRQSDRKGTRHADG